MHNKNSNRSYYPFYNDSKHSRPSHDLSDLENPDLLPDKAPPFKSTLQKPSYVQTSVSERPDTRYQSINYSENFKSQATRTESMSYDDNSDNKRLSMWPRNQKDLKRGPLSNNETKSSDQVRERVPSKTLQAQSGLPSDVEKSKSRSRIRSSLYGSTENEYGRSKEYISPRFRKVKAGGAGKNNKSKRKREGKDFAMTIQSPLNAQKDTENSNESQGTGGRLCLTEKLNPKKFLSPSHEEKRMRRGQTGKGRSEKERTRSKRSEMSRQKGSNKITSFDDKVSKSQENREYRENDQGSRRFNTRDFSEYTAYENEYKGWDNSREQTDRLGSREYQDWYLKSAQEQSRVIELEEEVRDREYRLEHMNRFQHDLYENYLEVKGELETRREENHSLLSDIKFYVSQNEILKRELNMVEHQSRMLSDENQRLIRDQMQRSELITAMESHIGKLKGEVASLTKKCNDQTESYNARILRFEREMQELRHEKGNLEKQLEEGQKHKETRHQEERALLKSLDERNQQVWELKQRNEKLVEELEKLKEQRDDLLKRAHQHEKEAATGKYGPEIYEPKRLLEQTLTQGKYENSPETFFNMRKSRAETDKMRETEGSKFEGIARSTLKKIDNLETSTEKLAENDSHRDKEKVQKSLDFGELNKIMKNIMQEIGVGDVYDTVKKIKEIQENGRTEKKFVSAILDLVYKCSNKSNFEGKPTTRQAWKWLQGLMEEYMLMKKQQKNSGEKQDTALEKEIIKNLTAFLETGKTEIVDKVKNLASENIQMKGVINKLKAAGVEHSFGIGEFEKLLDKHGTSYSSQIHSYSTAKFEEPSRGHRGLKEISFGRTGGPNLRKMIGKESFEIAEVMVKKESD